MKYTEKADKPVDKKLTKNLTPKQKARFERLDKAHAKPKTMAEDRKVDIKNIAKVKRGKR